MNLASIKHVLLALGIGVIAAACEGGGNDTPDMTTTAYTWTKVSTDIKTSCAIATSCHQSPTATNHPFAYDKSLTPGSDMANYTAVMALIDKTTPANSPLIVTGRGGMYMGTTHSAGATLSATKATDWANWITAGATFQ